MNIGILFMLGVSSLGVLGVIMGGWASNSHYPLMGALRSGAQMVSYEVAMGLTIISAVLMTSLGAPGRNPEHDRHRPIAGRQGRWFIFKMFPLGLIAFVIFAIAMVAETNRAPFDLPEAESELVAGFMTEYSGFRWSLFFLAEYAAMLAVSSIAVTMWLGGWLRPFPNLLSGPSMDLGFLVRARPHIPWRWRRCAFRNGTDAEDPAIQDSDYGAGRLRGATGFCRPPAACAGRARAIARRLLVRRQSCLLYVLVHLVSRDVSTLPLRPVDESGLEDPAARQPGRPDRYRDRRRPAGIVGGAYRGDTMSARVELAFRPASTWRQGRVELAFRPASTVAQEHRGFSPGECRRLTPTQDVSKLCGDAVLKDGSTREVSYESFAAVAQSFSG